MSAVCPQGHTSQSTDYCDICGEPMAASTSASASASAASSTPAAASPAAMPCPNCGTVAAPGALFCENCGYDFTTGTAPTPLEPPDGVAQPAQPAQVASAPAGASPASSQASSSALSPGGALALDPPDQGGAGNGTEATPSSLSPGATPEVGAAQQPTPAPAPDPTPATAPGADPWVAEVWVDPDWYAEQQPEDPLPSVGVPRIVVLREASVLVGRPSRSRGIEPAVDCGADNGVSRRHCELSTDGQRWWVEDLGSANGTYTSAVGEPLPVTPLDAGAKRELEEGERIYLGGWTRLVVRRALPGEA